MNNGTIHFSLSSFFLELTAKIEKITKSKINHNFFDIDARDLKQKHCTGTLPRGIQWRTDILF